MTSNNKHNEYVHQAPRNPRLLVLYTSAGKITRLNPNYNKKLCGLCGKSKGFFGLCNCDKNKGSEK